MKLAKAVLELYQHSPAHLDLFAKMLTRKISVRLIPLTNIVMLQKKTKKALMIGGYTSLVLQNIGLVLSNKHFTKLLLAHQGISVPHGFVILPENFFEANQSISKEKMRFPLHVKQENSQKDISSIKVANVQELKTAFVKFKDIGEQLLVETTFVGETLAIYIDDQGYFQALKKTAQKQFVPRVSSQVVKTLGDSETWVDVTNELDASYVVLAKRVLQSFSPLPYCSFKLKVSQLNQPLKADSYVVLEVFHAVTDHFDFAAVKGKSQQLVIDRVVNYLDKHLS